MVLNAERVLFKAVCVTKDTPFVTSVKMPPNRLNRRSSGAGTARDP